MDTSGTLNESWKESDLPHVGLVFHQSEIGIVPKHRCDRPIDEERWHDL